MATSFNIIGSGQVGTCLGLLLHRHGLQVGSVYNRNLDSTKRAIDLIGAGHSAAQIGDIEPADITVFTVNDDALESASAQFSQTNALRQGDLVFHCSGATPSTILAPLAKSGAQIASLHPVMTFTDPAQDAARFPGTACAIEGDAVAVARLEGLFTSLGAVCFQIDGTAKLLYHASAVFVSNYLHCLFDAGAQCLEAAGLPREKATEILGPLITASLNNTFAMGPAAALTGPIARGDAKLVAAQLNDLKAYDSDLASAYAALGAIAVDLSRQKGAATPQDLDQIATYFKQ
ncbi:MAG: Rossmann-like and DUF2520 domain-containing protein [Pseudomonadota bacterium]